MSRFSFAITVLIALATGACTQRGNGPTAPSQVASGGSGAVLGADAASPNAEQPPFNLEVLLRGDGFGLVKFRQEQDPTQSIVTLDTFVRDLAPNTSYSLQRAVDVALDGVCTNTSGWLTLGEGLTPQPIVTDNTGTAHADLWRNLSAFAPGSAFDINFRVIENGTGAVVLQSECYRFVVRD
jgi:hypothetical protein